ncbi:MAG TPA: phosphoglycerate dehydrogenase [Chthonomonadales bacterium]|nr:phosphoglycerate dehydrogenase [Chthonomonadales bacterium]
MHRVLVTDAIAEAGVDRLHSNAEVDVCIGISPAELLDCIGAYDALAVRSETKVTAQVVAASTRLKVIGRAGVGVDNIDVRAATERGIVVVNSPEGNTIAAAELSIAMLLALARRIPQADASLRAGRWERGRFLGSEVYQKTLGVIGLGKIGSEVARRARAFEMTVLAYDPFATEDSARHCGASLVALDGIYARSDFITLHVPLTDKTRGLIGADEMARMKDGVRIVNCARGGIVDELALADAVRSGKVAGAAFDVFTTEPPAADHPLLGLQEVIVTPHLGASTAEAQVNVATDIADQIIDVLNGRPARAAVNMPSLSAEELASVGPYLALAEKIGSLHTQLSRDIEGRGEPIEAVEVAFQGDFDDVPTDPVTRAVLAGVLSPVLSDPVNLVNAPMIASARGLRVTESHTSTQSEYNAMLTVRSRSAAGERTICGAVFGRSDIRVVHIDGYRVDIVPSGSLLITLHEDRPGMIGAVGTLLGTNAVNIAGMNVGRREVGGQALMVLMLDQTVTERVLTGIRSIPGMEEARLVHL